MCTYKQNTQNPPFEWLSIAVLGIETTFQATGLRANMHKNQSTLSAGASLNEPPPTTTIGSQFSGDLFSHPPEQ